MGQEIWEKMFNLAYIRIPAFVSSVIIGAYVGDGVVGFGLRTLWERNNAGKRCEDISVLEQRPAE